LILVKRALVLLFVVLVQPAYAFDPTFRGGNRVTLLQAPLYNAGNAELQLARNLRHRLVSELRGRGFEAVDSERTYADVQNEGRAVSGLYVEIAPSDVDSSATGAVAIDTRGAGVDLAMIVSRIAAELRVYDGRTFELIAKRHLSHQNVSVVPTGIGAGSYRLSVWFALPFVQYARYRAAAGAVVREAVEEIVTINNR
jgi:hypothetical protein